MTDRDLLEKRLAWIVTSVEMLRVHARPEEIASDPVQRGFVEHQLQTAIQAAIDVASIIVSERRLGEPHTSAGLFDLLAEHAWLSVEQATTLRRIVAFRNIVVHRYLDVDPDILRGILTDHLDDLLTFVRVVRDHMDD